MNGFHTIKDRNLDDKRGLMYMYMFVGISKYMKKVEKKTTFFFLRLSKEVIILDAY